VRVTNTAGCDATVFGIPWRPPTTPAVTSCQVSAAYRSEHDGHTLTRRFLQRANTACSRPVAIDPRPDGSGARKTRHRPPSTTSGPRSWRTSGRGLPEDLITSWTLIDSDWELIGNKTGATRVGFALMLKFFELEARFPREASEFPPAAVTYVAEQVKVDPAELSHYDWSGRAIERHRMQIRGAFEFRMFTRADQDKLADWLANEVCPVELRDELREALLVRCRAKRIDGEVKLKSEGQSWV